MPRAGVLKGFGSNGNPGKHSLAMLSFVSKASQAERGASRQIVDPFQRLYTQYGALEPYLNPEMLLQLAEQNAIHYACLKAKSLDAVGRGWRLEPEDEDADAEEVTDNLSEILESLTPDLTFSELLQQAAYEMDTVGWSAWEIVRDPDTDEIAAIYPLPAHTLRATKDPRVWVQLRGSLKRFFATFGIENGVDGNTGSIYATAGEVDCATRATEVLVFKTYSPRSPFYGVPGWIAAIPAIAELTAIREFNVSFFGSGGQADRIIHAKAGGLEQAKWLSNSIRTQMEESGGQGHVTLFTAGTADTGVSVEFMSPTTGRKEGQFIHRREDLVKEVLMAHMVPPFRIGWAVIGSLGGSAAREMLHSYRLGAIEPIQTMLEDRLNQRLFGPRGIHVEGYKWVLSDLDWDETELDLEFATKSVEGGLMTPNEGRDTLGQDHIEDPAMDKVYYHGVPLTQGTGAGDAMAVVQGLKDALDNVVLAAGPMSLNGGPVLSPGQTNVPLGQIGQGDADDVGEFSEQPALPAQVPSTNGTPPSGQVTFVPGRGGMPSY